MAATLVWALFFVVAVSGLTFALLNYPKIHRLALTLMVFSTCHIKKPFYQELLFREYRGVDRGFGVTFPDIFFFSFALYLLIKKPYKLRWTHPGLLIWWGVIGVSLCSLGNAGEPFAGLFTIHKFMRASLLFWVIMNMVKTKKDIMAVVHGLVAALAFQSMLALWNKYITKTVVNRVLGSFNHPNAFAMYLDMIMPVVWAGFMEKIFTKKVARWAIAGVGMGFMCVLFTKSRACTVLLPLTLGITTGLSFLVKPSLHKSGVTLIAVLAGMVVMAMAMPTIIRRFETAPEQSAETRHYFNDAAAAMADDLFFGCGINNYAWALKETDYYWYMYPEALELSDPEAFREGDSGSARLGTCHNIYWLFAGETGYLGLAGLVLMFICFYAQVLWGVFKAKDPLSRAVMCGLATSFPLIYVHSKLEWVWRQTQAIYLYFILAGLMVAVGTYSKRLNAQKTRKKL
jgi:hypothetical protein